MPLGSEADREADDTLFGKRGVENSLGAEAVAEVASTAKNACSEFV